MRYLEIKGNGNGSTIGKALEDSGVLDTQEGRAASFSTPDSFHLSVETVDPSVRAKIESVLTQAGLTNIESGFVEGPGGVFVNPHETDD
ncbi:hypothetical protein COU80_03465 [Candidatus Peregrinibacteria bacterium CG10_big_fil_rev_8_21_14_0_10_55_24]|nr:MAG: hypothetical protein COU80_03465 [Candidatus Peregrinibacteria bacterium CG10_big_fil_rev_8_21_14_0_10_55_24]